MAGMSWSSSGHVLCVWDSVLDVSFMITYQNLVIYIPATEMLHLYSTKYSYILWMEGRLWRTLHTITH